jgi:hypothetical protein
MKTRTNWKSRAEILNEAVKIVDAELRDAIDHAKVAELHRLLGLLRKCRTILGIAHRAAKKPTLPASVQAKEKGKE